MSARSMTGYARVREVFNGAEIVASVKSVNHRGLDIHLRLGPELEPFENALRAQVKQHVTRGHLQVQIRYTANRADTPARVNLALLEAYVAAYRRIAAIHGLPGAPR